jgi:hypothetical protein
VISNSISDLIEETSNLREQKSFEPISEFIEEASNLRLPLEDETSVPKTVGNS